MDYQQDKTSSKEPKAGKGPLAKRIIILVIFLAVVFGSIFGYGWMRYILTQRYLANYQPPPVTISTTKAVVTAWTPYISAIGSLVAVNNVQVTAQVSGLVTQILFNSGQMVKQGQPLVQLDDRVDQAELINLRAAFVLAQIGFERQRKLLKGNNTAQSAYDAAITTFKQAEANVERVAVILDQKKIRAPFDGKIGIRQVNLGQYVAAGTPLVSLQSLNPIYVQFSLPEQYLRNLYVGQTVALVVAAWPNQVFIGNINAVNSEVNADTRNILVEATVPNAKYLLYPGMFADIHVILSQQQNLVTLPQTAISYSMYGDSVYVVTVDGKDKDGKPIFKAHLKYVTLGDRRGNEIAVLTGVAPGDIVVTSGQLKLNDGTRVVINNSVNILGGTFNNRS